MRALAGIRENLLDLKIRVKTQDEDTPVPLQQDIRMIDYLAEFEGFVTKHHSPKSRRSSSFCADGKSSESVMDEHRGTAE